MKNNADEIRRLKERLGQGTLKTVIIPHISADGDAAGLAIGIILFFNHAGKIKLNDDPTPFEVQMRLYERDVNDTLMINAGRKGEEADVDS